MARSRAESTILGMSYKPGTDVVEGSQGIPLARSRPVGRGLRGHDRRSRGGLPIIAPSHMRTREKGRSKDRTAAAARQVQRRPVDCRMRRQTTGSVGWPGLAAASGRRTTARSPGNIRNSRTSARVAAAWPPSHVALARPGMSAVRGHRVRAGPRAEAISGAASRSEPSRRCQSKQSRSFCGNSHKRYPGTKFS